MVDSDNNNPLNGLINDDDSGDAPWSLETTQRDLLKYTKMYISKYAPADSAALKRIAVNTKQLIDSTITEQSILQDLKDDEAKLSKESDKILKNITKGITSGNKQAKDLSRYDAKSNLVGGINKLSDSVGGMSSSMINFDGDVGRLSSTLTRHIPIIGAMLGAFIGVAEKNKNTWQSLGNVGQSFGNDMFSMSAQLHRSGMGFDNAAKFLTEYSHIVTTVGSKSMLDLQKSVRQATDKFGNYGMTVDQVAQFTGSLMEQQIAQGHFDKLNDGKQAQRTGEYMKTLKTLATLTGRQVEELDKEQRAMASNVNAEQAYQRILHSEGKEAADKFRKQSQELAKKVAVLGPEGAKQAMQAFWNQASGVPAALDKNIALLEASGVNVGAMMDNIANASSPEEAKKAMSEYIKAMIDMGSKVGGLTGTLGIAGGAMKGEADDLSNQIIYNRRLKEAMEKNGGDIDAAFKTIGANLEKQTTTTDYVQTQNELRDAVGETSAKFQTLLSNGMPSLNTSMGLITIGFNMINGLMTKVSEAFDWLKGTAIDVAKAFGLTDKSITNIGSTIKNFAIPALIALSFGFTSGLKLLLSPIKLLKGLFMGLISGGKSLLGFFTKSAGGKIGKIAAKESAEQLAKTGGKSAAKIGGKATAKIGGKALGKSLLKKLPGIGLIAGLGFAAGRLMDGDALGALGEVASGLVSIVPGLGTAASIAIDAALAARDVANANNDAAEVTKDVATTVSNTVNSNKTEVDVNKVKKPLDDVNNLNKSFDDSLKTHLDAQKNQLDNITKSQTYNTVTDDLLIKVVTALDMSNQILFETAQSNQQIAISVKRSEPNALGANHSV